VSRRRSPARNGTKQNGEECKREGGDLEWIHSQHAEAVGTLISCGEEKRRERMGRLLGSKAGHPEREILNLSEVQFSNETTTSHNSGKGRKGLLWGNPHRERT